MHTSVPVKAEEVSKLVFPGVRICPVPVCSEETCKNPQNNHTLQATSAPARPTSYHFLFHSLSCLCLWSAKIRASSSQENNIFGTKMQNPHPNPSHTSAKANHRVRPRANQGLFFKTTKGKKLSHQHGKKAATKIAQGPELIPHCSTFASSSELSSSLLQNVSCFWGPYLLFTCGSRAGWLIWLWQLLVTKQQPAWASTQVSVFTHLSFPLSGGEDCKVSMLQTGTEGSTSNKSAHLSLN